MVLSGQKNTLSMKSQPNLRDFANIRVMQAESAQLEDSNDNEEQTC